jgi:hypothetical protein
MVGTGCGMEDFIGGCDYRVVCERDAPQTSFGISGSVDDDLVVVIYFYIVCGETGFIAVITEGAYR